MSSLTLKIIAIISMLFDHTGYTIFGHFSFMNYIGRLAFPIFAFCITEGYIYTKNLKRYFLRLIIFAIISQIPFMLFENTFSNTFIFNIIFTLILGLLSITIYDKAKNKILSIFFVILLAVISQIFSFDYGWFGITVIFIFFIFKNKKILMNLSFSIITFINYFYSYIQTSRHEYLLVIFFVCLSLVPINLYNTKKGKDTKYLLYIFYPLHLILLYLIRLYFIK